MTNFSFPIPFLLYLLYFSFPQYGLSQPYGPITISSSMNCGQIEVSDDGEVFLCGASFGLNILSNNMSNFEITQTLSFA